LIFETAGSPTLQGRSRQKIVDVGNLPEGLKDSTIAEHLWEVCELDLSPLNAVLPPKGFGRD
jgi:hypothetical protein